MCSSDLVLEALAFLGLGSLVLLIPTACMGATLPILASGVVRRAAQIGKRVGWLYAINTFGAVGGTVLAAFYLIPNLGLWQTSFRSEERRVGKEGRSRWSPYH